MKALRIFLLILIIIGLAALFNQKVWVPKLVAKIIQSENQTITPSVVKETQPSLTLIDGRQCYSYYHEATAEAPYTVSEFIDLTIQGTKVSGNKRGSQSGPDMTNGYNGTIDGVLDKNIITDTYSYIVEGSKNKEKEIYHANKTGIEKLRYPLLEEKGLLVPDTTKNFSLMLYSRVGCVGSN